MYLFLYLYSYIYTCIYIYIFIYTLYIITSMHFLSWDLPDCLEATPRPDLNGLLGFLLQLLSHGWVGRFRTWTRLPGELRGSSPPVVFDRFSSPGCPNVPNNLEGCSSQESACAFCHKRSHTWRIWWRPWGLKRDSTGKNSFLSRSPSHPPTPLRCHGLKYI